MRTAPTLLMGLALVATAATTAHAFSLEAAASAADSPHVRNKRLAVTNCVTNPLTTKESVLEDAKTVQITCTFDTAVETCLWTHVEPIKEGTSSNNNVFDIKCTAAAADNGQTCPSDSRVTFQFSGNTCGIQLSSTKNTDTGKWKMSATALSPSGGGIQTTNREIDLWTWNTTKNYLYDRDDKEIREYDTSYNFNERQNEWEKDKNSWETVEFSCLAMGGRPEPKITWYIGSNDRDDLSTDSNFRITQSSIGQVDRYGFITNTESIIAFTINRELMEKLKTYSVDINPRDEIVRFDLTCQTMQGMSSYVQKLPVSMRVKKSYDNGALASDTIGIIVGVIVAVIILVVAIGILLFAKASNRWCFASDDYSYGDARDPKSHPRTVTGGGGGGRSAGTGGGHHTSSGHQQQRHHRR